MRKITTLTLVLGIAAATACTDGMPTEPVADPTLSAPTAAHDLLSLDLLSTDVIEVVETVELFALPPVSVPGTLVPVTMLRTSSGSGFKDDHDKGHREGKCDGDHNEDGDRNDHGEHDCDCDDPWSGDETTTTMQFEGNPCTEETILFEYRTREETRQKIYRDGTVKTETVVLRKGEGEVVFGPDPLAVGHHYWGENNHYEQQVNSSDGDYTADTILDQQHFIRQGNINPLEPGEGEDFFLFSWFHQVHDERGRRTKHFETTGTYWKCY